MHVDRLSAYADNEEGNAQAEAKFEEWMGEGNEWAIKDLNVYIDNGSFTVGLYALLIVHSM